MTSKVSDQSISARQNASRLADPTKSIMPIISCHYCAGMIHTIRRNNLFYMNYQHLFSYEKSKQSASLIAEATAPCNVKDGRSPDRRIFFQFRKCGVRIAYPKGGAEFVFFNNGEALRFTIMVLYPCRKIYQFHQRNVKLKMPNWLKFSVANGQ